MRSIIRSGLAAVLLTSNAVYATAERPSVSASFTRQGEIELKEFAKCVLSRHHATVIAYFQTFAQEDGHERQRSHVILDGGCIQSDMTLRAGVYLVAAALAEAEFKRDFAGQQAITTRDIKPLKQPAYTSQEKRLKEKEAKTDTEREALEATNNLWDAEMLQLRLGECIVREDAVNARLFLLSEDHSNDEKVVIDTMKPALTKCLSGFGTTRLNRTMLKDAVAINYVRLALAHSSEGKN